MSELSIFLRQKGCYVLRLDFFGCSSSDGDFYDIINSNKRCTLRI